jgi:uncharacterized protein (UPF0303 family)
MAPDVQELVAQEEELAYSYFDQRSAWELGSILVRLAQERSLRVAIAIDLGEQQVFRCGLPGSSADNDNWLRRKFAVVRRYNRSSLLMATLLKGVADPASVGLDSTTHVLSGGGFPLLVGGSLAGCVGVSGLPDIDDHALVVEALRLHHGRTDDEASSALGDVCT